MSRQWLVEAVRELLAAFDAAHVALKKYEQDDVRYLQTLEEKDEALAAAQAALRQVALANHGHAPAADPPHTDPFDACRAPSCDLAHLARAAAEGEPIPMVLHCPTCGRQHVDAPEPASGWTNPPHRSHQCQGCGTTWRPADVPTTGVAAITTRGTADTWPAPPEAP